jgi:hypothetical protein
MSANNAEDKNGNTGEAPAITKNDMDGEFENVNVGTGESVATANAGPLATAEPIESNSNSNSSSSSNSNSSPEKEVVEPLNSAPPSVAASSKKGLSVKQSAVQRLRAETLDDMRSKYAERFSNTAKYPKPPKAKAPMAAKLTKLRQEQGEAAYNSALRSMMDEDDPLLGPGGKSRLAMRAVTQRKKKANAVKGLNMGSVNMGSVNVGRSLNSVMPPSIKSNVAANRGSTALIIESITEMGATAKGLIDTMMTTSKQLAKELAKSGNSAALSQLSNMAPLSANNGRRTTLKPLRAPRSRTTQKKGKLPPIFENSGSATSFMSPEATE